jgi:hypothetical protein
MPPGRREEARSQREKNEAFLVEIMRTRSDVMPDTWLRLADVQIDAAIDAGIPGRGDFDIAASDAPEWDVFGRVLESHAQVLRERAMRACGYVDRQARWFEGSGGFRFERGVVLMKCGFSERARLLLRAVVEQPSGSADRIGYAWLVLAEDALQNGQYSQAISAYGEASRRVGSDPTLQAFCEYKRAWVAALSGESVVAESSLAHAVRILGLMEEFQAVALRRYVLEAQRWIASCSAHPQE